MIFIDKSEWFEGVFARVVRNEDIIGQPLVNYHELSDTKKDLLRQTQVFQNEIVQVLGKYENFSLIRKFEKTIGWILNAYLELDLEHQNFILPKTKLQTPFDFLSSWKGVN